MLVCFILDCTVIDHARFCNLRAGSLLKRALASRGSEPTRCLFRSAVDEFRNALLCGAGETAESAHLGLGQALLELGETASGVQALEAAVERAPCDAHALTTLATGRSALGDHEGAYQAGKAACLADPRSSTAFNNLGLLLCTLGRHGEALAAFSDGLKLDAYDVELLVNSGVCLAEMGRIQSAMRLFAAALKGDPAHARARDNLASCMAALHGG